MAWLRNTKGGRSWFGKAEAKANGKRARRQVTGDLLAEGYAEQSDEAEAWAEELWPWQAEAMEGLGDVD